MSSGSRVLARLAMAAALTTPATTVATARATAATAPRPPTARDASAASWTISTLATGFEDPVALAVDGAGDTFVADARADVVYEIAPGGARRAVAGTGRNGFGGDGGPAQAAALSDPRGLALDSAGDLYVADFGNDRVREVRTDGTIQTVAGNGTWGSAPDGTLATSSPLEGPTGVAVDPSGDVVFTETTANQVRKIVAGTGVLVTVAGTGVYGSNGDGGPAVTAHLAGPLGVAVDSSGRVLVLEAGDNRIRAISPTGIITTLAGDGSVGESGDGHAGPAARLDVPSGLAADPAGDVFLSEASGQRVREVAAGTGVIFTVAGTGQPGLSGDGGPAPSAALHDPEAVAVTPSGAVEEADAANHRIRVFTPPGPQGCASRLPTNTVVGAAAGPGSASPGSASPGSAGTPTTPPTAPGYALAASDGAVATFGGLSCSGSELGGPLSGPVAAVATTPDGAGYWLASSDGSVYPFGDARALGPSAPLHPAQPIVGMAVTPDGGGYWLVSSGGGVFAFGDARFFGSTAGLHLSAPIVGMAATNDGGGYWLVGADGGIFTYGNAPYLGSAGRHRLRAPVVGMAADPATAGYWLVGADGGVFSYGAPFLGAAVRPGGGALAHPIVGMTAERSGRGYWLVSNAGSATALGDAPSEGSAS